MAQVAIPRSRALKDLSLVVLSGSLLALSLPKFNLEFLAWFSFLPLFIVLKGVSKPRAFFLSFACGLVFWDITVYWLVHVTLAGAIVLALYLALYFGLFGLLIASFLPRSSSYRIFLIPSIWVLLEFCRSHLLTGFPWALLGYSQYLNLPVIQIADISGALGVSFIVMMVNAAFYSLISPLKPSGKPADHALRMLLAPLVVMACVLGYGFYKLNHKSDAGKGKPVKISVIQGNIPQELKWYPQARQEIITKYLMLTRLASQEKPDLIVWPEAAVPVVLEEDPAYYGMIRDLAKQVKTPLLFGAVTSRDNLYYNSALMVSQDGEELTRYDKLHLVPFGEYIPLRTILPFLQTIVPIGDVTRGTEYTLFGLSFPGPGHGLHIKFATLICFEDVFPELSRQFVARGANFLVNITNDAWYKRTFASYQHFQASVFRAVENRVFVVRSANTGLSGFISPEGKIISLVRDGAGNDLFVDGFKSQQIMINKVDATIYNRFGDLTIVCLCALITLFSMIACRKAGDRG
jgi:apolipoprotein N-acyltransferase